MCDSLDIYIYISFVVYVCTHEQALLAARKGADAITEIDIQEAIMRTRNGVQGTSSKDGPMRDLLRWASSRFQALPEARTRPS